MRKKNTERTKKLIVPQISKFENLTVANTLDALKIDGFFFVDPRSGTCWFDNKFVLICGTCRVYLAKTLYMQHLLLGGGCI